MLFLTKPSCRIAMVEQGHDRVLPCSKSSCLKIDGVTFERVTARFCGITKPTTKIAKMDTRSIQKFDEFDSVRVRVRM